MFHYCILKIYYCTPAIYYCIFRKIWELLHSANNRNMVHHTIKGAISWQDPSTWITYESRQYTESNFKLFNRSCPRCTEVRNVAVRYPGTTIKRVEKVSSYTECKDICTREVECKVWTFTRSDENCRLKSKNTVIKTDSDKVSWTRACFD